VEIQDVLPRDAIPSIDYPSFGSAYFGEDDDEAILVEDDLPQAYPVRIPSYHEIVNDRMADGRVLTFGTSGKLADDALVMYDRETGSEWKQPLGKAINGSLEGHELSVVPATVLTWGQFRSGYPEGIVLQPVHGGDGDLRGDIDAKTVVVGVTHGGDAAGYPVEQVRNAGGVVSDTVGDLDVLVVSSGDDVHAFEDPGYEFELQEGMLYGDGAEWDARTGRSDDRRTLPRVPSRRLYAFTWQDDHGPGSFYGLG
jgi:hypothetical protein